MIDDLILNQLLPLATSALGGAMLIISVFALVGKADILSKADYRKIRKNSIRTMVRIESIGGIIYSLLLLAFAGAIQLKNAKCADLMIMTLVIFTVIFLSFYFITLSKHTKK